ncbi:hypothetical protein ACFSRY_03695 [Pontibacter locisalis]|uniref:Outer membrane protein beta-barrel domain-containing protein n=1 Tax=Pontibacter locisalis TaxID=1719035 RepID=A0ABW5IH52_9BACT
MKKLFLVIALLIGSTAEAQEVKWGFTGRFGAFATFTNDDNFEESSHYGLGLQAALGAWVNFPVDAKSNLQISVLQVAERQRAGETVMIDENRNPITKATITDQNLAVVLQALYLYSLSDKWSAGLGAGAKYEFLSQYKMKALLTYHPANPNYSEEWEFKDDNPYRRKTTLHLPIETQYRLNDKFTLVGQVQLPLNSRTAETSYKEYDVNLSAGINYAW